MCAQYLGGIVIVLELIGQDKIRSLSNKLNSASDIRNEFNSLKSNFFWIFYYFQVLSFRRHIIRGTAPARVMENAANPRIYKEWLLTILVALLCYIITRKTAGEPEARNIAGIVLITGFFCGVQFLVFAVSSIRYVVKWLISYALLRPIASLLGLPAFLSYWKIASFLLITIGFSFDLLAS